MFLKNSPLEVLVTAGSVAGDLGEVREVGFVSESMPLVLRSKDLLFFQFTFCFLLVVEKVSLQLSTATYIPFCCLLLSVFPTVMDSSPSGDLSQTCFRFIQLHYLYHGILSQQKSKYIGVIIGPKSEKQRIFVSSAQGYQCCL